MKLKSSKMRLYFCAAQLMFFLKPGFVCKQHHATGEIYWRIFSNLFCQYLLDIIVHKNYLIWMSESVNIDFRRLDQKNFLTDNSK